MLRVGDVLKQKRITLGWAIFEASKRTRISSDNLEKIEGGRWNEIPSVAYARGMTGKYAASLGLDDKKILTLLKRELSDENVKFIRRSEYEVREKKTAIFSKNTVLLGFIAACILFFVLQLLVFWQRPLLKLEQTPLKIESSDPLVIKGRTEQGVLLYLNDERLYQNEEGQFYQELYLKKGSRQFTIRAVGQNGREEVKTLEVQVK